MGFVWRTLSMIAVAIVIVLGAGIIDFARPHRISEPILGTEWQCSRVAFVITCNHRRDGALISTRGLEQPGSTIWFGAEIRRDD